MKQRYVLMALVLSVSLFINELQSQTLPNTDFETWVPSGKMPPFDWEEPDGWKSTNAVTEFTAAGITKTTDAKSGVLAVKIRTANVFGNDAPGILVNGDPVLDFNNFTLNAETGGTPVSLKPDILNGYYKYSSTSQGDSAYVMILLKKWNTVTNESDLVGMGNKVLGPDTAFTAFQVDVTDLSPGMMPDTVITAFYSSRPASPMAGGELIIDNIALAALTGIEDDVLDAPFSVYPNPVISSFLIDHQFQSSKSIFREV